MTGAPPLTDMTVVIKGERIRAIDKTESVRIPKEATIIDGRGKVSHSRTLGYARSLH
jgi:imidazolonepropionase-like amidohydrolase